MEPQSARYVYPGRYRSMTPYSLLIYRKINSLVYVDDFGPIIHDPA